MGERFDIEKAREQLEQLGQRIEFGRAVLGRPHSAVADEIERDWKDMQRKHQALSLKLRLGCAPGSQAAETLRHDIDELRHGFSRWAAQVERRFNGSGGR